MNLEHQQQPTNNTCVSACLAMLLNEPVDKIIKEFHDLFTAKKIEVDEYLHRRHVKCRPLLSVWGDFTYNRYYFLAVPSLNIDGTFHQIILYYDDNDDCCIMDPNKGRKNKRYYIEHCEEPANDLEFCLKSYACDYEIWK